MSTNVLVNLLNDFDKSDKIVGEGVLRMVLVLFVVVRPLVKSVYQKNNFLISQPKHMLWILKRTVSMRRSKEPSQ